ncbi:Sec-independent protein translocase protein TatB [Methylobacterium oxalidis]|nr:Sec-independent protein translocase protein TatB [Methylobacterium oxalidis]
MLDMSWGEVMLIGGVALIVIGPKDLPKALRTVGQITGKLRRMAGEFQMQFNEAIREAELDEVRREVDGIKRTVGAGTQGFNPVQTIRDELKGAIEARDGRAGAKPGFDQPGSDQPGPEALAEATASLRAESAQEGGYRARERGSYDVPRPPPEPRILPEPQIASAGAADPLASDQPARPSGA